MTGATGIDTACVLRDSLFMGIRDLPTRRQPKLAFHLNLDFKEERRCLRPTPSLPTSSPS